LKKTFHSYKIITMPFVTSGSGSVSNNELMVLKESKGKQPTKRILVLDNDDTLYRND